MRRLMPDDKELLKSLYKQFQIPTDQYKRRPAELAQFTAHWNMLADRSDDPGELLHYMVTQRKMPKWVRLGKNHKKLQSVPPEILTEEEWGALRKVYEEMHVGSDNYAFDANLRAELERTFALRVGRIVSGVVLISLIEAKRKRGLWVTIGRGDEPFADMDAIAQ